MNKKTYLKKLEQIQTGYFIGVVLLFSLGFVFIAAFFNYLGAIGSWTFMFIFACQHRRLERKISQSKENKKNGN